MKIYNAIAAGFFVFVALMSNAWGSVYDVCEGMSDEIVSSDDFFALFEAIQKGDCNDAVNVKTSFSLSKDDFYELAYEYDMVGEDDTPLVFFRDGTPSSLGIGAIIVYGNDGDFPVMQGDRIHIWSSGRPADIIIEVSIEGCNPYDDKCDSICSYEDEHVCDPLCYEDGVTNGIQCDIDCVDANGNHAIDEGDLDGICDPDCYNDDFDPKHAYDPDCVDILQKDDMCDPDSNGMRDGVCDPDCAERNHMCDFDCNGEYSAGNPNQLTDLDCYECDGICNGFCSYDCTYYDNDPDCPEGFTDWYELAECCGNDKCEQGENCFACTSDCPPNLGAESDCSALNTGTFDNFVCCPLAYNADVYGCANITMDRQEGEECPCGIECAEGLACSGQDEDKHCCPDGSQWNGTDCGQAETDVLIVALKSNLLNSYSSSVLENQLEPKIDELITAMGNDGLGAQFLYLDEQETADITPGGVMVTDAGNWQNVDSVLDVLIPALEAKYLLIIGGYATFPFPQFSTGSCDDPYFSQYQTDDPYGDYSPRDNMPDITVSRIPDPNGGDINMLLNAIDTSIALHNSGGIDISSYGSIIMTRAWPTSCPCASSGSCFHQTTFGMSCSSDSRCHDETVGVQTLSNYKYLTLLMHGSETAPQYFQDDPCGGSFQMSSYDVASINVDNALWMIMSCYSSYMRNKQSTAQSIPLQFLNNGGAIYTGGSLTQMGDVYDCSNCPKYGDNYVGGLYQIIASNFAPGVRIGDAYIKGKNFYMSGAVPDDYACNARQGHENMMFGDPTIKIKNSF